MQLSGPKVIVTRYVQPGTTLILGPEDCRVQSWPCQFDLSGNGLLTPQGEAYSTAGEQQAAG